MKHVNKWLCLLLCLTMLVGVFAGCTNNPTPDGEETTSENAGGNQDNGGDDATPAATRIRVIYPDNYSNLLKESVNKLKAAMIEAELDPLVVSDADSDNAENTDAEILVGATNRPASGDYLKTAGVNAYTVRAVGNKTVLAGASDILTVKAVDYFIENYVAKAEGGTLAAVETFDGKNDAIVKLVETGKSEYVVSYDQKATYLTELMPNFKQAMRAATGVEFTYAYAGAYAADKKEILIGTFDVPALASVKKTVPMGGYTIAVVGNKILLAASDKDSYKVCFDDFSKLLKNNASGTGTQRTIMLDGDYISTQQANKDLAHMPIPSDYPAKIIATADNAGWTAVYQRSSLNFFNEYKGLLESNGFTKYASTNFDGANANEKNYFVTYVKGDFAVRISFHTFNNRLYLTSTSIAEEVLPVKSVGSYTDVTNKYSMAFVSVGEADLRGQNSSMCYIMRLADGSFFIIDAGLAATCGQRIYQTIKKMAPDPKNVVISGWFITHAHGDHTAGFDYFMDNYKNDDTITFKQFVHNFPHTLHSDGLSGSQNRLIEKAKAFNPDIEILRLHAGDVMHYPGATINVLYTQEEYLGFQDGMLNYNSASVVTQIVTDDGSKILVGADHPVSDAGGTQYGCEAALWRWYGNFIQSDLVTSFHHGLGGGADNEIYYKIAPSIVFWACDLSTINLHNLANQGRNKYFKEQGVSLYVSDDNMQIAYLKNGTIEVVEFGNFDAFRTSTTLK